MNKVCLKYSGKHGVLMMRLLSLSIYVLLLNVYIGSVLYSDVYILLNEQLEMGRDWKYFPFLYQRYQEASFLYVFPF